MNDDFNIYDNGTFKECGGSLICSLVGGSNLYGLNTPESDIDYRGVFISRDTRYLSGLKKIDSIVTEKPDSTFYEIVRFFELLRKTNTQALEILFAPDEAFVYMGYAMELIRSCKYSLFDSNTLKNSLRGYVFSEIRLATGQRSGQLGSKRKEAVNKYGFSPKNFTQILRLCELGKNFFKTGEFIVRVKDYDVSLYNLLMEIKTQPQNFTCNQLESMVNSSFEELTKVMDESSISYKFDENLAADLIYKCKYK